MEYFRIPENKNTKRGFLYDRVKTVLLAGTGYGKQKDEAESFFLMPDLLGYALT